MTLPDSVTLCEVGPRDGFQLEQTPIPTALKLETIDGLADAGFRQIQVTSFVHPGRVPQMADAEELCQHLDDRPGVTYSGLALNLRGVERALAAGIRHLDVSISSSETHSRKNANLSVDEALAQLDAMVRLAREHGAEVRAGLQCVFGCAYEGAIDPDHVLDLAERIAAMGIDTFSVADTTGMANPLQVRDLLTRLRPRVGDVPVILHLHDTRGAGIANLVAALDCGVTWFDTALGGLGGCPFVPGAAGNLATEDVVQVLEAMGIRTGIDIGAVAACSRRLEAFLGRSFPGKMYRLATA